VEQQFAKLIDQYNGILYKIARSFSDTGEDLRDLYQEMLIQIWQAFPSFRGESKVSTWLYRVALNTALSFQKKQNRKKTTVPFDQQAFDLPAEEYLEHDHQRRIDLLYSCINQLSKDERAIILLHLDEKTYEEIAEIIGITVNLVGVKIHRIKKRLQQLLLAWGYVNV
jgi:RNA polymerase sigma-70 factor (ECF subfamily)